MIGRLVLSSNHQRGGKHSVGNCFNIAVGLPIHRTVGNALLLKPRWWPSCAAAAQPPHPSTTWTLRQRWLLERNRWVNLLLSSVAMRQAERAIDGLAVLPAWPLLAVLRSSEQERVAFDSSACANRGAPPPPSPRTGGRNSGGVISGMG